MHSVERIQQFHLHLGHDGGETVIQFRSAGPEPAQSFDLCFDAIQIDPPFR